MNLIDLSPTAIVYLSGPMSGYKDHNFPAFDAAEAKLRSLGFTNILNPAEMSRKLGMGYPKSVYMRKDYESVLLSGALYVLDEWYHSTGACGEIIVARDIAIPIISAVSDRELMDEDFHSAGFAHILQRCAPMETIEGCVPCQPTGWKPA